MQAISINPSTQSIENIDIEMQANTVYTFFSSILIDELTSLKDHTIYTDANALQEDKIPFFIGEQLLLGNSLIMGSSALGDSDTQVPTTVIEELISYEVSDFYTGVFQVLSQTDINLYRFFSLTKDNQKVEVNLEWTLGTFNIADERTKEYFINELKKSLESDNTQETIEKMAQLALNVA